jgi:hypothetical protein
VRGVVRCLKARGHDHVVIAEGWGAKRADWSTWCARRGTQQMASEEHVPLVAMDDDGVFDVQGDLPACTAWRARLRMEGTSPSREYLAWSPPRTAKPDFHVPEAFGTLVVDP